MSSAVGVEAFLAATVEMSCSHATNCLEKEKKDMGQGGCRRNRRAGEEGREEEGCHSSSAGRTEEEEGEERASEME